MKIRDIIETIGMKTVGFYRAVPPKGNSGIKGVVLLMLCIAISVPIINNINIGENSDDDSAASSDVSQTSVSETEISDSPSYVTEETEVTTVTLPEFTQHAPQTEQINASEVNLTFEAEDGELSGELSIGTARAGFSGNGYVTNFTQNSENKVGINMEVPVSQHYDITITFASDAAVKNSVIINGSGINEILVKENQAGSFITQTIYGVYMQAGQNRIAFTPLDGNIDIDKVTVTNNSVLYNMEFAVGGSLCNPAASPKAQKLMGLLTSSFGKTIITGQHAASEKNVEIDTINSVTGKKPVIRFGDMAGYSPAEPFETKEVEASLEWAEQGGVVGLMWHWAVPMNGSGVYSEKSTFNLAAAITDKDVARMPIEELQTLFDNGEISAECLAIIKDIDSISAQLARLRDADVPVLWRPLHEADGGWYWWGSSNSNAYRWLWSLLYTRQTEYHNLNNLIWVWCGQSMEFLVPENMYDIAATDIYLQSYTDSSDSFVEQYLRLYAMTGKKKILALSETGTMIDTDIMLRDRTLWSYFGTWYGSYMLDEQGNFVEKSITKEQLIKMYNSEASMTLDEYIALNSVAPEQQEISENSEQVNGE